MPISNREITVLLPTYNGARFLSEQLASLFAQENVRIRILLRDDASEDDTVAIARTLASQNASSSCTMQVHTGPRLGVVGNVSTLLELAEHETTPYFALADQDDIWHPSKLTTQLEAMYELENRFGSDVPLLVCSDARCVDAKGAEVSPSFLKTLGIPPSWGHNLRQALVKSWALGCSCIGNAALRRMAAPLPPRDDIFMHDWWLLLVAQSFGAVRCLGKPLLDYRQHENNVFGSISRKAFLQRLKALRLNVRQTQLQAQTFLFRYKYQLTAEQRSIVSNWADMPETPWLYRRWKCWRQGFRKPGFLHI